jgi:hypothetical protein
MQRSVLPFFSRWALLLLLALPFTAGAQMFYTPPTSSTYTGGSNSIPLNSSTNKAQFLYLAADFNATIPAGVNITTIYIKPSATVTNATYNNFELRLANTTLTALTSGTWNTTTPVYTSASASITTTSNNWLAFTLPTPFNYTGGNILFELSTTNTSSAGISINQFSPTTPSGFRRMYGTVTNTSSTGADGTQALLGLDVTCFGSPTAPTITTNISTATPICSGSTTTLSATNPNVASGVTFQWQTGPSATGPWTNVTNGSGGTTLSYTTGALTTNAYFRVAAICSFSSSTSYSSPVLVPVGAPQPGTISGSSTFCPGDVSTYSVTAAPGTTYTWTLPTGWASVLTAAPATNSINVTPNTTAGNVSVTATSSCGTSIAQTRAIVAGSNPLAPSAIQGNRYICGNTPQTYSIPAVAGATSYIWTLPAGWAGTSNTNTINVTNASSSGNVTVRAVNGCGQSLITTMPVSVITALANPGTITGKDTVCSGVLQTYSINPVNGATSYVWTLPSGWSGTTTGTSVQVFGGTTSGPIRVTAYASCATSPAATKQLTGIASVTPTVTLSAPPSQICQSAPLTLTATATGAGTAPSYVWRRNGTAVTASGSTYTSASFGNGDIISVTLTSNAACATTATATATPVTLRITPSVTPGISVNSLPEATICRGTNVDFFTTSNGGGTAPTYQWYKNGILIPGATGPTYSNNGFDNNDTIHVVMSSNAVCATTPLTSSNKAIVHVVDKLVPSVSISVSPSDVIVPGQPVTFTASQSNGGATPDFQWMRNGVIIPFATGATYTSSSLQPNDNISVRMVSYLSCVSPKTGTSNIIVMHGSALSVPGTTAVGGMILYPNPSNGVLNVRGDAVVRGGLRMEVLNTVGQVMHRVELPAAAATAGWNQSIELPADLATGHYLLRVSTAGDGARLNLATLPFMLHK